MNLICKRGLRSKAYWLISFSLMIGVLSFPSWGQEQPHPVTRDFSQIEEFMEIRRRADAIQHDLDAVDPDALRRIVEGRKDLITELEEWAKRYGVQVNQLRQIKPLRVMDGKPLIPSRCDQIVENREDVCFAHYGFFDHSAYQCIYKCVPKTQTVSIEPLTQPSYRTVNLLAEIDNKTVKSEELNVNLFVDKKPIFSQIIGGKLSLNLSDWVEGKEQDVVLKITYKRYELDFTGLSKNYFQGQWAISIITTPKLDPSEVPNAENVDYAYRIEFQSRNKLGTVWSKLKYRNSHAISSKVALVNAHRVDIKAKVTEAVAMYPRKAKAAHENLRALGVDAIPLIVKIIKDNDSTPKPLRIKKIAQTNPFLISVIASIPGKQADIALIELLSSKDVMVRGRSAVFLGNRKSKPAIPSLIQLLNDSELYQVYVTSTQQSSFSTSPASAVNVLIRDVAVRALEEITGTVLAGRSNSRGQAKTWRSWWKKQQKSSQSVVAKS